MKTATATDEAMSVPGADPRRKCLLLTNRGACCGLNFPQGAHTSIRNSTMRCSDAPTTRELARQLLVFEEFDIARATSDTHAVVRVCDKVRRPLATLAGPAGFQSLFARALSLAKRESPDLRAWDVKPDGSLRIIDGKGAQSSAVLVGHLIGLMINFIGESLTLRILHEVWSELPDYQDIIRKKENQ